MGELCFKYKVVARQYTILLLLFLLSIAANARTGTLPKRKKPITTHNFSGSGIITLVGGTEGKYFKNIHFANNHLKVQVHKTPAVKKAITKTPPLPMPILKIDFIGGTDKYKDSLAVDSIIKPLATYLLANEKVNITLIGNTGGNDKDVPTGGGNRVYNAKTNLNGKPSTYGELMEARTAAVKNYLVNKYSINADRINTERGTQQRDEANRTVGVEVQKGRFRKFIDNLFGGNNPVNKAKDSLYLNEPL